MRNLSKDDPPPVLSANRDGWDSEFQRDPQNQTYKYRYRHADIKQSLLAETNGKCIYCESKVGHNTPGDVEHKIPSVHALVILTLTGTTCQLLVRSAIGERTTTGVSIVPSWILM